MSLSICKISWILPGPLHQLYLFGWKPIEITASSSSRACPSLLLLKNSTVSLKIISGVTLAVLFGYLQSVLLLQEAVNGLFVCFFLHSLRKSFLPCSGYDLCLVRELAKITLKEMGSTNFLVKQPISHLFIRAGRNTRGNHSSVPLNSLPCCLWHGSGAGPIVPSSIGQLIAFLKDLGQQKEEQRLCYHPCKDPSLQIHCENGQNFGIGTAAGASPLHKISLLLICLDAGPKNVEYFPINHGVGKCAHR